MKRRMLFITILSFLAPKIQAQPGIRLHSYRDIKVDVDLPRAAGPELKRNRYEWLEAKKTGMYEILDGYDTFAISRDSLTILNGPHKITFKNFISISSTDPLGPTPRPLHMEFVVPVVVQRGYSAYVSLEKNDQIILSKLTPTSGYTRYVSMIDDVVLGESILPAGSKPDQLILKIFANSKNWEEKKHKLLDLLNSFGIEGAVKDLTSSPPPSAGLTRFRFLDEAFADTKVASPILITLSQQSLEVFQHEPVVFDATISNRGIPSHEFYYSTKLVASSKDYLNQFSIIGPDPSGERQRQERLMQANSLKYLESKTLSFNCVRDFSMDYSAPGPIEIPLRGQFFQYLDGKGITETTKFTVKVLPLPEEHLRKLEEWKSRVDTEQVVSVEQLTANGKELSLLILRRAGKVARVLRFGELPVPGKWSLAQDTASGQMHILFSQANGGQTYWRTEPLLTGLLAPEVFKEGKRRTLQISADGKVLLAVEP